jgi:hypothetical protein
VDFSALTANVIGFGTNGSRYPNLEYHNPTRTYAVFEYIVDGTKHYLAVNRGYGYCGDVDEETFSWLVDNCAVEQVQEVYDGGSFPDYHPVPKSYWPVRAIWFGKVKDREKHAGRNRAVQTVDITNRKVRRRDFALET